MVLGERVGCASNSSCRHAACARRRAGFKASPAKGAGAVTSWRGRMTSRPSGAPFGVISGPGAAWRRCDTAGRAGPGPRGEKGLGTDLGGSGAERPRVPRRRGGHSRGTGRFCPAQPSNISPFPSPRKHFPVFIARRVPNEMSVPQLPHPALPQEPLDSDAFPPKQYPKPAEKCMFSLSCKGPNAKLTPSRLQLRSAVR